MIYKLRWNSDWQAWMRIKRGKPEKVWKGTLAENFCSSLTRVVLSDVMLKARSELEIRPALCVHDNVIFCVPTDRAAELYKKIQDMMRVTPAWWRGGPPLDADGKISDRYGGPATIEKTVAGRRPLMQNAKPPWPIRPRRENENASMLAEALSFLDARQIFR